MTNLQTSASIIGTIFNRLTVTEDLGKIEGRRFVIATCVCGITKTYRYCHLQSEAIKSCGCYKLEQLDIYRFKHGLTKEPTYKLWCGIKRRCYNENEESYKDYGGRGIAMCEEWKQDFKVFHTWCINNGHKKGLIMDRIKVNLGYNPSNCRFVTTTESARNTRVTKYLELNGVTKSQAEWAEITGISSKKLSRRILRDKWTVERALSTK